MTYLEMGWGRRYNMILRTGSPNCATVFKFTEHKFSCCIDSKHNLTSHGAYGGARYSSFTGIPDSLLYLRKVQLQLIRLDYIFFHLPTPDYFQSEVQAEKPHI